MKNIIITISREYGSGGRFIGQTVAKKLNIPFYDKDLIEIVSKKIGFTKEYIELEEEKLSNDHVFFNAFYKKHFRSPFSNKTQYSSLDKMFNAQSDIIKEISKNPPCIIVGRCADFILKENDNCLNIFIHASADKRIKRIVEEYNIDKKTAWEKIEKTDKHRANYHKYYTGRDWGDMKNYHIVLDSGYLSIDKSVNLIIEAIK